MEEIKVFPQENGILEFKAGTHTYTYIPNDRSIPSRELISVNGIMQAEGVIGGYGKAASQAALDGTFLHHCLENVIKSKDIKEIMEVHMKESLIPKAKGIAKYYTEQLAPAKKVFAEAAYMLSEDEIEYVGTVDVVFGRVIDGVQTVFVDDLKTGTLKRLASGMANPTKHYALQINGYRKLISKRFNLPIENIIGRLIYVYDDTYEIVDWAERSTNAEKQWDDLMLKHFKGVEAHSSIIPLLEVLRKKTSELGNLELAKKSYEEKYIAPLLTSMADIKSKITTIKTTVQKDLKRDSLKSEYYNVSYTPRGEDTLGKKFDLDLLKEAISLSDVLPKETKDIVLAAIESSYKETVIKKGRAAAYIYRSVNSK